MLNECKALLMEALCMCAGHVPTQPDSDTGCSGFESHLFISTRRLLDLTVPPSRMCKMEAVLVHKLVSGD